jgi:hypothetical protein
METVGELGLVVERTKTSIDDEFCTLNSTLFSWGGSGKLVVVPTLRFGMLRPADYPTSLGKSFKNFLRGIDDPVERWRAGKVFFDFHLGELKGSSWSLPSLGFSGSLAHRLARTYGLLSADRLTGTPPAAPIAHSVCLSPDLVSEVPNEFCDAVVRELNACEVASWKWSRGWSPESLVSEAIRYSIAATRWTDDSDIQLQLIDAMSLDDRVLSWRYHRGGRLCCGEQGASRRSLYKPFLDERPARTTSLLHYNIVLECLNRANWFWGPLPTYEEACSGVAAVCGAT